MYPSDYGFAVGGIARENCLEMNLGKYNENNCYTKDWLRTTTNHENTLMHSTCSDREMFSIETHGYLYVGFTSSNSATYNRFIVRPTIYLNSNITLSSGTGTTTDPFILKVKE